MRHWLIRLAIFGAIATGMSGVALAQTCPPGYMLQDDSCYAPTTPAAIDRTAEGFHNGRVSRTGLPAVRPRVVGRRASPEHHSLPRPRAPLRTAVSWSSTVMRLCAAEFR